MDANQCKDFFFHFELLCNFDKPAKVIGEGAHGMTDVCSSWCSH